MPVYSFTTLGSVCHSTMLEGLTIQGMDGDILSRNQTWENSQDSPQVN